MQQSVEQSGIVVKSTSSNASFSFLFSILLFCNPTLQLGSGRPVSLLLNRQLHEVFHKDSKRDIVRVHLGTTPSSIEVGIVCHTWI